MPLQRFINSASSNAALAGFIKVKSDYLPGNEFLPNTNLLKIDAVRAIGRRRDPYRVSPDDTKAYLAVSSLMHCFDGWNYLSSAIDSLINGEKYISVHLSYYAELRASMSFLATEGIGIFDHDHICATGTNTVMRSPDLTSRGRSLNGTHAFIWESLAAWINYKQGTNTLNYFSVHGKSFDEWIRFIPNANNAAVISLIVKDWLKEWSFDINNYKNDRSGRNTFSYRPTRVSDLSADNLDDKLIEVNQFWKMLEPENSNRFALLDKYLFKILFEKIFTVLTANGHQLTKEQLLDQTFVNARLPMDAQLKQLILTGANHTLLTHAQNHAIDAQGHAMPLSVIARAILMLRFSSGATGYLLKLAGITKANLQFYWNIIGVDYGFWDANATPNSFITLWDLVNDSIEDIEDWRTNPPGNINLKELHGQEIASMPIYTQFHRAGLWGTGF
ncbi:hypothetical protein ABIB62_003759 [Mucilaginibacter sp. UYP25]|uniref:hypothetical protein n=1 Tax=unclassified Mucilaginibacter TaxID=2617802 RepID=UPI003398D0F8